MQHNTSMMQNSNKNILGQKPIDMTSTTPKPKKKIVAKKITMLPKQESNQNQTREYNELMEEVDHVVDYDWKSAAILLSKEYLNDINLDQEQNTILYGTNKPPTHTVPLYP